VQAHTPLMGAAFDAIFDRSFHRIAFGENGAGSIADVFVSPDIFSDNLPAGRAGCRMVSLRDSKSPVLRDDMCGAQDVSECLETQEITRKQASAGKSGSKLPHSKFLVCNIYLECGSECSDRGHG